MFQAHRLVVAKEVLEEDMGQVSRRDGTDLRDRYSLMHQITRLTRREGLPDARRPCGQPGHPRAGLQGVPGLHAGEEFEAKRERDLEDELHKFDETFSDPPRPLRARQAGSAGATCAKAAVGPLRGAHYMLCLRAIPALCAKMGHGSTRL